MVVRAYLRERNGVWNLTPPDRVPPVATDEVKQLPKRGRYEPRAIVMEHQGPNWTDLPASLVLS